MAAFLDACRFSPTAGGTTDWTYSAAVLGYQSPAAANAVNGTVYAYRAESADLSQWEIGKGAYNTATGVWSRTTVLFNSSSTAVKINFTTTPQVACVALKEDLLSIEEANSFTAAQQAQSRANISANENQAYGENVTTSTFSTAMAGIADSVPLVTDGTVIVSAVSHTASLSTNNLLIEASGCMGAAAAVNTWVAVFQGSTCIAAMVVGSGATSVVTPWKMTVEVPANVNTAQSYTVRAGNFTGGATVLTVNGAAGTRRLGGAMRQSLLIKELKN